MKEVSNVNMGKSRRLLIGTFLIAAFVVLELGIYAFVIQASARSLLTEVYTLKVGSSSVADLERLGARHRHILREHNCDSQNCTMAFEIYNTWLYRTRLEPVARFRVDLEAEEGKLNHILVILSRDTRVFPTAPSAGMTEEYHRLPQRLAGAASNPPYWFPTPVGKPYLWVALSSQASDAQRQHAYAYSLRCLIKLGWGCDLPCDYLPLAWRDWQANLEKTGPFGAGGFGPYYPSRNRCE
jgi:hypothetical protein